MQIESLKVFCDLAETKSFTKAAQINNVTQSAVSQTISALERRRVVYDLAAGNASARSARANYTASAKRSASDWSTCRPRCT